MDKSENVMEQETNKDILSFFEDKLTSKTLGTVPSVFS